MQRFGFGGRIFPINPTRTEVQGLKAFPSLRDTPDRPELAIIAVPAANALSAVQDCAERGVEVAVVLTSGFGETGAEGRAVQDSIIATARGAGMRIIGPNTQGVANFGNGTIASFATLFSEIEPGDGPVGIVSQSGAMSVVPYAHLRRAGIGVRYAHATGNEADVTVADLAASVLDDPDTQASSSLYGEHRGSRDPGRRRCARPCPGRSGSGSQVRPLGAGGHCGQLPYGVRSSARTGLSTRSCGSTASCVWTTCTAL
jgi:acyl-CoA synthetase (NDP forming)